MDRLTFRSYETDGYYYLVDCGADYAHPKQSEAVQKLAVYENTGLTPEEIEELRADATALFAENKVLKKEKEIYIKAFEKDLKTKIEYKPFSQHSYACDVDINLTAENLYNAGYRKTLSSPDNCVASHY